MNLILLFPEDFLNATTARLTGRRLDHIRFVLKSKVDDALTIGVAGGRIGVGIITSISDLNVCLELQLNQEPPQALPLKLIIPMIRPLMFRRLLFHATTLGIKHIYVVHFNRVEKSFWSSSVLRPEEIKNQLILGLEQSKDTHLPQVEFHMQFKPFVKDVLPEISRDNLKLVAHPLGEPCPRGGSCAVSALIGPEGGFVEFERELFDKLGFKEISLAQRIVRVETALPLLVGKLF